MINLFQGVLEYDWNTGEFLRVNGGKCGSKDRQGYIMIEVGGKKYCAHRLAYLFMGKEMPPIVDHINGGKDDNRWCNLREATHTQNNTNIDVKEKTNLYLQPNGNYKVEFRVDKKKKYFGCHELELAQLIRDEARRYYHGDFAKQEKLNAESE